MVSGSCARKQKNNEKNDRGQSQSVHNSTVHVPMPCTSISLCPLPVSSHGALCACLGTIMAVLGCIVVEL